MGSDPDDTLVGKSGKADGTSSVGDEVEESTDSGDHKVGSVSGDTVGDSSHTVFTYTVSLKPSREESATGSRAERRVVKKTNDVSSSVVSETSLFRLEVDSVLPSGL